MHAERAAEVLTKDSLRASTPLLGMQCFTGSPTVVELLGYRGFDFVVIDMEHTPVDIDTVAHMIRAANASSITPLVRTPGLDANLVTRLLDAGAAGIHFPRVQSADEAQRAVDAVKYPLEGNRGLGGYIRASQYADPSDWDQYVERANKETFVSLILEDMNGVNSIEAIAKVPGIDVVSVGRADLAQSMGHTNIGHPDVVEAAKHVASVCRENDITIGRAPTSLDDAKALMEEGVRFLNLAPDVIWFSRLFKQITSTLRD